jgi:ABC-type nitrate/sulfonate/bicarbonate transport system substrate-binding protein
MNRRTFVAAAGSAALAAGYPALAGAAFAPASINIINTGSNDSFALQSLVKQQKYLEEFNLSATTLNVSDGIKLTAGVLSGASDIGLLTGFLQIFPAIEHGAPLKLVGCAMRAPDFMVVTGNPNVKTLKDLEGKSVGTGAIGALVYAAMAAMLKKANVDISKVTFVNIGSSSDVFKAVAARKVDAGPCQHDFAKVAAQFNCRVIADAVKEIPQFTNQGSFTTDKAIAEKRDALVRALAVYGRAYRYIDSRGSKANYVKAYVDGVGGDSAAAGSDRWDWIQSVQGYETDIALSSERIMYAQQLNVALGNQKAILPLDKVADMSLARDAVKLLKSS